MEVIETMVNPVDAICASLHMSLSRLSRTTDIPVMTLHRLRQNGNVTMETLKQLAERINVEPDDVLFGNLTQLTAAGKHLPIASEEDLRLFRENRQKRMLEYGYQGEAYVAELERKKLAGTPYADAVNTDFAITGKPFDILSFDEDSGEPILIEVKSTCYGPGRKFIITQNEMAFLMECVSNGTRYELHRVYHVNDPERRGRDIYTPDQLLTLYDIQPRTFECKRKDRSVCV